MTRNETIELLVRRDLSRLSAEERGSMLLDWWSIDAGDPEYDELPELLKVTIARDDEPHEPMSSLYEPLLRIALRDSYTGVLTSYLSSQLAALGYPDPIHGEGESLAACPCCGYRSLRERGQYEICRVCFWEDDGTTDPDTVSGPNHMTLREARQNVSRIGAVDEAARPHVLPDGRERYARET